MRKLIPFSSLILYILGICFSSHLVANHRISSHIESAGSELTISNHFNASPPPCNTPTWPSTSNITQTTATFNWSVVSGALNYSVQTRLPNGTWYYVPGGPFTYNSITADGFSPNTTYEWRVRANCSGGLYSYWTSAISFTTLGGSSCNAPSWLYTTNITQTTATFSWSSVSGAMTYSVQWRLAGGTWYYLNGGPWANTWLNVGNFQPGTAYEWRVRSNCANGMNSAWSYSASFTTLGYSCYTPTWPSTSNISQTSATFSWDAVPGAQSYTVQTRLLNGTWYDVPGGPFTNTYVTVNGLNPGTTYQWRVRANCSGGQYSYWTSAITFTTLGSTCNAPTWLYTTNISQNSATLDWTSVSGAVSYSIQWRYAGGTWYDVPGGPWTESWYTLTNLQPNTDYEWRVRSNCYNGNYSPWSYGACFTTLGFSCYTPTWPSTSNITQTSATFSWDEVWGAQSYTVQTRLLNGTWYDLPGGPIYNVWVTVNGLNPNTTYQWRVRANCGGGQYSYWTSAITFTTLGASCNTPNSLYTTNITQTSATLDWSSVSGAVSYSIQWRYAGGTWYDLPGGPWTQSWLTISGLQPGTDYEWRVRSNCYNGLYSPWSYGAYFTTLGYSCSTPTWPTTSNVTQTSATFSWDPVPGAQNYTVQTRLLNGTWYDVPGGPFNSTTVTVNGLNPNTTYQWRVRANCGNGQYSYWTSALTFTTLGNVCSTPTWPTTSNITETSATFSWDPVPGALNYTVQTRLPNGTWYDVPGGPFVNTSVTVTGFNPNTTYQWRVRANCGNGQYSPWTYPITFTTNGSNAGNNNCIDATLLTVNSTCINTAASNVGATPSLPPPSGECWDWGYKDVWFRFAMPNVVDPTVTIRTTAGTMYDAVMEIYVGTNCSDLTFLSCEDDNSNGNNSPMPVINLIGYQNAMIWIRVWGYGGSVGTFNICLLNYQSNNFTDLDNTIEIPYTGETIEVLESEPEEQLPEGNGSPLLRIAPNPASDVLYISYAQTTESIVSGIALTDMSGKIMLRKEYESRGVNEFEDELDVSGLTPGIYILQVRTTKGVLTEKISVVD